MSDNDLIYHYTSADVLNSLINNKDGAPELWLTRFDFQNDIGEYHHGLKLIEEYFATVLDDLVIGTLSDGTNYNAPIPFSNYIKYAYDIYQPFTISFSTKGNLLSQWNTYCPPEGGFSIGIDRTEFFDYISTITTDKANSYLMATCIYDDKEFKTYSKEIFEKVIKIHHELNSGKIPNLSDNNYLSDADYMMKRLELDSLNDKVNFYCAALISSYAISKKHNCFSNEEECRLIINTPGDLFNISFRTKNNHLIPYIEIPFNIDLIKKIYIGPSPKKELAIKALNLIKKKKSLGFDIVDSELPFIR